MSTSRLSNAEPSRSAAHRPVQTITSPAQKPSTDAPRIMVAARSGRPKRSHAMLNTESAARSMAWREVESIKATAVTTSPAFHKRSERKRYRNAKTGRSPAAARKIPYR